MGERVPLGLRVTADLKRKLDAAAEASGRSQSQEAEFRLENSFNFLNDPRLLKFFARVLVKLMDYECYAESEGLRKDLSAVFSNINQNGEVK